MAKQNWKAQNTRGILKNIKAVLETGDISKLSKAAYKHIISHLGFIAHYNLGGFQDVYSDVSVFAQRLLTSELSCDKNHNRSDADRYVRDGWFANEYGMDYCQSVADCNIGIIELVDLHMAAV